MAQGKAGFTATYITVSYALFIGNKSGISDALSASSSVGSATDPL